MLQQETLRLLVTIWLCLHFSVAHQYFVVPKGKRAMQSSKYTAGENPDLGMDGNNAGVYTAGVRCFQTVESDPLPWWMVDMERIYVVYGARVWNRLDSSCSERFTQISIGVSSNPSVWTTFSTDLFDLCMYWTGVPTVFNNPINFTCSKPIAGRYLAVYKNLTGLNGAMRFFHFCEIDILANIDRTQLSYVISTVQPSLSATSASVLTVGPLWARSDLECAFLCIGHPYCLVALARESTRECWLFDSFSIPESFIDIYSSGGVKFLDVAG